MLDLVVLGPPKSGTTWLESVLKGSKLYDMPKIKETNFFSSESINPTFGFSITSYEYYERLFSNDGRPKCEVCPSYFYFSDDLIQNNLNCKYIIILRDPLKRAISHAFMDRDRFKKDISCVKSVLNQEVVVDYTAWGSGLDPFIELSKYSRYIENVTNSVSSDNILFLFLENGSNFNLKRLNKFLGCEIEYSEGKVNKQKLAKNKALLGLTKLSFFQSFYKVSPEKLKKYARKFIYKKVDDKEYKLESDKIYEELKNTALWKTEIDSYLNIKEEESAF